MATTTLTIAQTGVSLFSTWADGVASAGVGVWGGIRATVADIGADLITGVDLVLTPHATNAGTFTVNVDRDFDSAVFETANRPEQRRFLSEPVYALDPGFTAATPVTIDLIAAAGQLRHADIATLGLILAFSGTTVNFSDVSLTVTHQESFTGLSGVGPGESRADRCPKTGKLGLRENWVRDGYTQMMVDPAGWDPPDHDEFIQGETPEREPIGEDY